MPPANVHNFLIYTLSFLVRRPFAGCALFRYFLGNNHFYANVFMNATWMYNKGMMYASSNGSD
jgi:hypothetical protein